MYILSGAVDQPFAANLKTSPTADGVCARLKGCVSVSMIARIELIRGYRIPR